MGTGIKRRTLRLLVLTAGLGGCAVVHGARGPTPTPAAELERGVTALHAQNYTAAREILEPLYKAHLNDYIGQRSLMLLTAGDLDPRNQTRRLSAAQDYAGTLLTTRDTATWQRPLAETLYLLSQELGAREEQLDRVEAAKQQAQHTAAALQKQAALPMTTRESWPEQLKKMRDDRDALTKKVEQLQATIKARDKDLADATQELERIKKTLKIK